MDGMMDGWLAGWMDGWMDGWMEIDGCIMMYIYGRIDRSISRFRQIGLYTDTINMSNLADVFVY